MNILDHAKQIAELIKKYNDQDLYERIVNLREEIIQLREDNLELREQVKSLHDAANIKRILRRVGNSYYLESDKNRIQPYCLTCWDVDRKLVSLTTRMIHKKLYTKCNICAARKRA